MGIPYYFYVISRSTPGILLTECPAGCADYFLDYNGVIHQAVAEIMDELSALPAGEIPAQDDPALEARMHKAIWDYTESCIRVVAPSQQVSICIDGVAPVAKMVQQRKRRYLSGLKYRLDGQPVPWDRNAISPGTPFMIRLHASLRAAIRNRDGRGGPYIYLSTSEDPGEGEHKIFQRIAGLSRAPAAGGGGPAPIVIHGLDADLIMLSLLSDTPGIYLMREPTHVVKPGDATSAAPGIPKLDPETTPFVYVSVDALRVALLADLSRTFRWSVDAAARADAYSPSACAVIRDYVALCFLLGNDFLPHPATLSLKHGGHDRLLHAARSATEATGLTATGLNAGGAAIVNAHYIAHVIRELAREEEPLLAEYAAKYLKRTPRPPPGGARFAPSEFYPLRPEHKDPCARALGDGGALKPAWQSTYYQHLFHTRMHDTRTMTTACQLFAHGLQWTLSYYKRQPKDALWYYPFGFAPTFRDLANFVASRPDALNPAPGAPPGPGGGCGGAAAAPSGFVDAMIQLLCIMPPESAGILPQHVRTLMTVPEYGCTHLFPRGYPIQTFLKTHLWECHPVLPALDIALMQRALSSLTTARRATEASPKRACDLARPTGPTAPTAPPPRSGPSAADRGPPQIPLRGPANVRYSSFGASGRAAVGRFRSAPGVPAAIAPAAAPPTKAAPR